MQISGRLVENDVLNFYSGFILKVRLTYEGRSISNAPDPLPVV